LLSGAGCGSRIHGARPLGVGVEAPACGVGVGALAAGVSEGEEVADVGTRGVAVPRGPGVAICVGPTIAGAKVAVPTSAVNRVGVGLLVESDEVASPRAENSAPTADQARLPSSKMPTMPTIMAISRAGEPSSGRADRSTSF
jgi:hypothetical protein